MVTIILAAGYGTRLYPLTLNKPKALLEVGGKTIMDRLVENIVLIKECGNIFIVTNEKFHENFEDWAENHKYAINIKVINDETKSNETRLGAIGDISLALEKEKVDDDLLITGSDNLFKLDLNDFTEFAKERKPYSSMVLVDVKDKGLAKKYGICLLNKKGEIVDFQEKPEFPKSTLAATCLYFIPAEKIQKIDEYMKTDLSKDAPGNLMRWLAEKDKLFGFVLQNVWYDIGDKKSLKQANEEFSAKKGGSASGGRRKEKK